MLRSRPPYEIFNPGISIFHASLVVCIGWLFTLYASWSLAEGILKKIEFFSGKLFPTLLFGGLIASSMSYCVEATGIAVGWWHWTRRDIRLAGFFEGVPLSPLEGWFFMFMVFMVPYFLIECSKYRIKQWKYLFILPSLFYFTMRVSANYALAMIAECLAIMLILYLSLKNRLLLINHYQFCPNKNSRGAHFMQKIPFFMVLLMLMVMIFVDLKIAKRPELLISTLPITIFILIYFLNNFLNGIFLLIFAVSFFGGKKFSILIVPVITFLAFFIISKFLIKQLHKNFFNEKGLAK